MEYDFTFGKISKCRCALKDVLFGIFTSICVAPAGRLKIEIDHLDLGGGSLGKCYLRRRRCIFFEGFCGL